MSANHLMEPHVASVQKGFELLAIAATFLSAVQAQVMTISINTPSEAQTTAICLINAFFLIGLVLDIISAFLAFLKYRWLQRLSHEESVYLEEVFEAPITSLKDEEEAPGVDEECTTDATRSNSSLIEGWIVSWSALSLFIPMLFLILGVSSMAVGIQIFIWTQQKLMVAILVTLTYVTVIPFIIGLFIIGKDRERRRKIIRNLGKRRGDW
ncbi:hypothetical protein FRB91_002643 [Serendipita sp. 411]|nr:hypothetical protein FRC20_005120 [Serendipita sp. 405]KAG8844393.1 hypothetical protein FRB91_002643 [Serendipita sp. 411]